MSRGKKHVKRNPNELNLKYFEEAEENEADVSDAENEEPVNDSESLNENDMQEEHKEEEEKISYENDTARMVACLNSLIGLGKTEYFLDYNCVTIDPNDEASSVDIRDHLAVELFMNDSARQAATLAREYYRKMDVPFEAPADFKAEMFKDDRHMKRVMSKKAYLDEQKRVDEETKRARRSIRAAKKNKADKKEDKALTVRNEKKVIQLWKETREKALKEGVSEENLPTLEQARRKFSKTQHFKRISKDLKYSHKKEKGSYRSAKKNDFKSAWDNDDSFKDLVERKKRKELFKKVGKGLLPGSALRKKK